MFNKYLTLAAVVVCTANAVNGYTYEVIDCMKPSRVNEYQLNSICPKVEVQQSMVEEEMMLLQVESEQVTKGYRCSVTSSTLAVFTSVSEWKFIIASSFKFTLLRQPEAAGCCPDH